MENPLSKPWGIFVIFVPMIKCSNCETHMSYKSAMDTWAVIDDDIYCGECQQDLKLGWFQELEEEI